MHFDLKTKLSRMEKVKQEKPAYRSILDFYEKIYIEKDKFYQSLKPPLVNLDEHLMQRKLKEGLPILDKNTIALDIEALKRFFWNLLQISEARNPDAVRKLASHLAKGKTDIGKTIQEMWAGKLDTFHWKQGEMGDPSLFSFLLIECLKPLHEYFAMNLREVINDNLWNRGYCPVCGEVPPLAEIAEAKGLRLLFCGYCGMEWSFPFLICPFCGNEEEEGIKYLYVENEKQYRIEVCKSCQKYIKVIDPETIGYQVPLDVENIITLHLDILAQRQGYRRGTRFPLLI